MKLIVKKTTHKDPIDQMVNTAVRRTQITAYVAVGAAVTVAALKGLHHVYYEMP